MIESTEMLCWFTVALGMMIYIVFYDWHDYLEKIEEYRIMVMVTIIFLMGIAMLFMFSDTVK